MHRTTGLLAVILLLETFGGCESTEQVSHRSALMNTNRSKPLTVFMRDSASYVLLQYSLTDSTLTGAGRRTHGEGGVPFSGSLRLSDIAYMQRVEGNGLKTVVAVAAVGFVAATIGSYLNIDTQPMTAQVGAGYYNPNPASGGGDGGGGGGGLIHSCPFIYSWDGDRYALDGEAYAVAWGKALEMTTSTVLSSVHADHGSIRVRIGNERPETHYTKSVHLKALQVDEGAAAFPDTRGCLWSVARPLAPVRAHDNTGADITNAVSSRDGLFWESQLSDISPLSRFEDILELTFPNPSRQDSGTLVLHAINTGIFDEVLKNVSRVVGDESLEFVRALESDPELIALMKEWTEETSLKVQVWNGQTWESAASLLPEADVVPFAKAVRIRHAGQCGDSVRIRLSSLADVWKVDAAMVDWTPTQPLNPIDVPLKSAVGPGGRDVKSDLSRTSKAYVTIFPSEKIDLVFGAIEPLPGKHVVYVSDVRGYLHEWMPESTLAGSGTGLAGERANGSVSSLKMLLRFRNVLLPAIYAEWRNRAGRVKNR